MSATDSQACPATFLRRMGAILYDSFLLFAVLLFAGLVSLPFTYQSFEQGHYSPFYSLYLLAVCYLYFAWQWHKGGQTLGMRTWHLYMENKDGGKPAWGHCLVHFLAALLSWLPLSGLGFVWIIFDKQNRALHDRISGVHILYRPRIKKMAQQNNTTS